MRGPVFDPVYSLAFFDDGLSSIPTLYAAGEFSAFGEVPGTIARWDGENWVDAGNLGGTIRQLLAADLNDGRGPALYAAGQLYFPGIPGSEAVMRWDGQSWSPLYAGIEGGEARAIALFDDGTGGGPMLYAAGRFYIGEGQSTGVIRWDGAGWSLIASDLGEFLNSMVVFRAEADVRLAVAGYDHLDDGAIVPRLTAWDGRTWTSLKGSFTSGYAFTLEVHDAGDGAALYVGGKLGLRNEEEPIFVARWDGADWIALDATFTHPAYDGSVQWLFSVPSGRYAGLYAGGLFSAVNGTPAGCVARWDGQRWTSLGGGVDTTVYAIATDDERLFVGGQFTRSGATQVLRVAAFDGESWSSLGSGVGWPESSSTSVRAMLAHDDGSGEHMYAGGVFQYAGGCEAWGIARWDGANWSSMGGANGWVTSLFELPAQLDPDGQPSLIAGGTFTTIGGVEANHVARWDGIRWSPLGSGLWSPLVDMTVFDDGARLALYAALDENIARWEGTHWIDLGAQFSSYPGGARLFELEVFDDGHGAELYAGGEFESVAGQTILGGIAKWDGVTWSPLAYGLPGGTRVYSMHVFDDGTGDGPALYLGGAIGLTQPSTPYYSTVAKWDGVTMTGVGTGLNLDVKALTTFDDGGGPELYAGGWFTQEYGAAATGVARWDGSAWQGLNGGTGGGLFDEWSVMALAGFQGNARDSQSLIVGGYFESAGGLPASRVAAWSCDRAFADADGDGIVGPRDLAAMLAAWGECPQMPCELDLNHDGMVNGIDLAMLLGAWG